MKLSVIIPCFNEKNSINAILEKVFECGIDQLEVIIVDDYSTDGTRELLKNEIEKKVSKVIYQEKNQGKGAALRAGFSAATGDLVVIQDADLEYDPNDYHRLIEPFIKHNADVVYGSRFLGSSPHRVVLFWHMLGNRFLTLLSNMFTNLSLTDMETCYKMFKREIIQSIDIEEDRFGFEPEITAKLANKKYKFYETSINYNNRTYEQGKKIGWKDGVRAIYCILKYNLRRNA